MTLYTDPYAGGSPEEFAGALGAYLGCIMIFTLIVVVLYLWLFYRIFKKAGYSGWMTLINLIPYVGSIIVLFMLAFGDWPALRGRGSGPMVGGPGYPPSYPPTGQPPMPPSGPGYQPPAPPMAQSPGAYEPSAPAPTPTYEPPAPPVTGGYEPPVPPAAPGEEQPPAPPAPPA